MTRDVIDLFAERDKRTGPDPDCVRYDDFGRPMFLFGVSYEFEGSEWTMDLWAYSEDEAHRRTAALCCTAKVYGQIGRRIPV